MAREKYQQPLGRHPAASLVQQMAGFAVGVDTRGEMGLLGEDLLGQAIWCGAAADDPAGDRLGESLEVSQQRTGRALQHEPQRAQRMIVAGQSGQVGHVGLEPPQRAVVSRGAVDAGPVELFEPFQRPTCRERPRPAGPELQSHGVRLIAGVADQDAAVAGEVLHGKGQTGGGRRSDVDHAAPGPAEPLAHGGHQLAAQRPPVAGDYDHRRTVVRGVFQPTGSLQCHAQGSGHVASDARRKVVQVDAAGTLVLEQHARQPARPRFDQSLNQPGRQRAGIIPARTLPAGRIERGQTPQVNRPRDRILLARAPIFDRLFHLSRHDNTSSEKVGRAL